MHKHHRGPKSTLERYSALNGHLRQNQPGRRQPSDFVRKESDYTLVADLCYVKRCLQDVYHRDCSSLQSQARRSPAGLAGAEDKHAISSDVFFVQTRLGRTDPLICRILRQPRTHSILTYSGCLCLSSVLPLCPTPRWCWHRRSWTPQVYWSPIVSQWRNKIRVRDDFRPESLTCARAWPRNLSEDRAAIAFPVFVFCAVLAVVSAYLAKVRGS